MVVSDLEEKMEKSQSEGGVPFLVAATAGTTVLGSFDPFNDVADICEKYNVWFHVDVSTLTSVADPRYQRAAVITGPIMYYSHDIDMHYYFCVQGKYSIAC